MFKKVVMYSLIAMLVWAPSSFASVEGAPEGYEQIEPTFAVQSLSVTNSNTGSGSTDLIAGQNIDVGEVEWEFGYVGGDNLVLNVTYETDEPWCMTETHLAVAESVDGIPQNKKGNPKVGNFEYGDDELSCVTYWSEVVDVPDECSNLVIAAHAVVNKTEVDVEAVNDLVTNDLGLPESGTINVHYPGGDSYFNSTIGSSFFNGVIDGWCIDLGHTINPGRTYQCDFYSSFQDLTGIVDKPENMDLVNYILNQDYVGSDSPGCTGNYTAGDVQTAIWELIDDQTSTWGAFSWCRVNEIVASATANGEAFIPSCNGVVALVCAPKTTNQVTVFQTTAFELNVTEECNVVQDETAWGAGNRFVPKGNWAMYIEASCPVIH